MLDMTRTRQKRTREMDVLSTDQVVEAGLGLTGVMETGKMKARRGDGTANTIFLGVSWITYAYTSVTIPQLLTVKFGAVDSGGSGYATAVLPNAASGGAANMLVLNGAGYGSPALTLGANKAAVTDGTGYFLDTDNRTLYVHNENAGKSLFVVSRYSPTVQQQFYTFGDNFLPKAAVQMNRIGILEEGQIYTSNFDPTVDWSTIDTLTTGEALVCGAGGQFTVNKSGAICSQCYVLEAPRADSPFLGLYIHK